MTTDEKDENLQSSQPSVTELLSNGLGASGAGKDITSSSYVHRASGPRTAQGKTRSKRNSLKHGVLAKVAMVEGESKAEFNALLGQLRDYFQPVGPVEEADVELLAVTRWHQRRLLIAEGAEIQAAQKFIEWDLKQRQQDQAAKFPPVQSNGGLISRIANPEALETCLSILRKLKSNVELNGLDGNENARDLLSRLYGVLDGTHWKDTLFRTYRVFSMTASYSEDVRKKGGYPSVEECKNAVLGHIEEEITRLLLYAHQQSCIESERLRLEALRHSVPDTPRLDRLLRYWTTWERTYERTVSRLERSQRIRRGQPVPPQINVNLSSS